MKIRQLLTAVFMFTVAAQASILSNDEFTIQLNDPNSIPEHGLVWVPQEKVKQTQNGLVFENPESNACVDFYLLTKAYPIGLSWRPTYGVNLGIELSPLNRETTYSGGILYPSLYSIYVRYSPDLKNWSSWHALQDKYPSWEEKQKAGIWQYSLMLQIPQKERAEYTDYLYRYMKMEVPWQSDEEAMVRWILTQKPDFFTKHIPFIGYVQFLCETCMRANQPLSEMKISVSWGVSGLHSPPKDESVYKNRDHIPWRFTVE